MLTKHVITEIIIQEAQKRIELKKEVPLSTAQYNGVYEAIDMVLSGVTGIKRTSQRK